MEGDLQTKIQEGELKATSTILAIIGTLYENVKILLHYSYFISARKFIFVKLQATAYNEYDPKITTLKLQGSPDQEIYFCSGKMAWEDGLEKNKNVGSFIV